MKKEDSQKLYMMVNSKETMDALSFYVNLRVEALKNDLVSAVDYTTVARLQAAIAELKRIGTLREEVNNPRD